MHHLNERKAWRARLQKARRFLILALLSLSACTTGSRQITSEGGAPIDVEKVNACLEKMREDSWTSRRKPSSKVTTEWHRPAESTALPAGCEAGSLDNFRQALKIQIASCKNLLARSPGATVQIACKSYTRQEWCLDVNNKVLELSNAAPDMPTLLAKVKNEFDWAQNIGRHADGNDGKIKKGEVKFTGYYSPAALEASYVRTEKFAYAFYRTPPDLLRFKPEAPEHCGIDKINGKKNKICRRAADGTLVEYHDRRAIVEGKVLEGKGLAIAYVEDPLDIVNIHLQGSGSLRITAPNGATELVHLVYEGSNGRTNHFLSRIFKCMGAELKVYGNLAAIRRYLATRPADQVGTILSFDPYFSFFRIEKTGPFGTDNLVLTPEHSLASDRDVVPTGGVVFFQTVNPNRGAQPACAKVTSLGISQDTGGGVAGAHLDWYMGEGAEAQARAESVHSPGTAFLALPKGGGKVIENCVLEKE